MDLRSLRSFVGVVDAGSLSKAAALLYIAQPALTAQIKKLEAELGAQILERSHVGVTPTPVGLQLYHDARRLLADAMGPILKQAIVIENKPGAGGTRGAQIAARSAPDGYTWVYAASPMAGAMRMFKKPGFDVFKDFAMVGRISVSDLLVIAPVDSGMRSVKDLLDRARKQPGTLNFASGGMGSPAHLGAEPMLQAGGASANHVPFKGASESLNAVIGKQVDFALTVSSVALPQWKAGKVSALGITAAKRNPVLPQVPTLIEQGLAGVEVVSFGGLAVPAGTSPAIVKRINEVMREAMSKPDVRAAIDAQGATPAPSSPEEYADLMRAEIAITDKMMKAARIEPQ